MTQHNFSLPERILKRKTFMRATHNGRKFVASGVILQVIPNEKETLRVGFTTTKKLGCAVIRNKIRRRLREAVRLTFAPKALIGYDYVFIGRSATENREMDLLKQDMLYVLRQFKKSLKPETASESDTTNDEIDNATEAIQTLNNELATTNSFI